MKSVSTAIAWPALLVFGLAACTSDYAPVSDAGLRASDGEVLFLVQQPAEGERAMMDALYEGRVVEQEGCLRLEDEPDAHTVVWPPGYTLVQRRGVHVVLDEQGRTAGEMGGLFRLSGGEVTTLGAGIPVERVAREAALRRCPGRYWIVGEAMGR